MKLLFAHALPNDLSFFGQRQHIHVQFRNHYFYAQRRICLNCRFDVFSLGIVQTPMPLYADTINFDSFFLQHFDHSDNPVSFCGSPGIEIVVIQFGIGGVLRGVFEGQFYQFFATANAFYPRSRTVIAIIVNDFVYHIPGLHFSGIPTRHGFNMLVQPLSHGFFRFWLAVFILKKPRRRLVMPNERMTYNEHVVFLAKLNVGITRLIPENPGLWIDEPCFHGIFEGNGIKLFNHNCLRSFVLP